jgi:hypothetical protein
VAAAAVLNNGSLVVFPIVLLQLRNGSSFKYPPPALHAWPAHAVAMRVRPARCVHSSVRKPVGLAAQW